VCVCACVCVCGGGKEGNHPRSIVVRDKSSIDSRQKRKDLANRPRTNEEKSAIARRSADSREQSLHSRIRIKRNVKCSKLARQRLRLSLSRVCIYLSLPHAFMYFRCMRARARARTEPCKSCGWIRLRGKCGKSKIRASTEPMVLSAH